MNKKVNTTLFILGATVFNILVTVLSFLLLLVIYAKTIMNILPEAAQAWSFPLIFITAIAVSFIVYRLVLKLLLKNIKMEKYFEPIFAGRGRRAGSGE